ncbi:MAG TPA: 3-phosphoshikimate 1-carboxyvinyltransferase [Halanaerobiales bacterium]|nr:3-phosphoshikimate 1-carboxyvinyltransferase [Halanaerobiales bacterium]
MQNYSSPVSGLRGTLKIPGDKSISHRSIIFASIAEGTTTIEGLLESEDCLNTIKAFRNMGISIETKSPGEYRVHGKGLKGLQEPGNIINCGNSGTTMRLLSGLLATQEFYSVLTGDFSLRQRPMNRIIIPLRKMGALIWARDDMYAPLSIKGSSLKGIHYELPVASAQVKSAILLAGLYVDDIIEIKEPALSRDHTERILKYFGGFITRNEIERRIILNNNTLPRLHAKKINIPGDISSAAYFLAAALIKENSELVLENIGLNPTRIGFLNILKKMNANFEIFNIRNRNYEPTGDIIARTSNLNGIEISGELIPRLIDEIPIIAVLATQAEGRAIIKNAEELRVKESDRIKTVVENLSKMGADIEELEDGMIINGPSVLEGGKLDCYYDHRIAMSLIIASLIARSEVKIENSKSINTSFPKFTKLLNNCFK